jgi:primosomal protein N' (replication factor Y)
MAYALVAEVALRATDVGGTGPVLSYRVPAALRDRIAVGYLVWVPLRNRRVQGIVLSLAEQAAAEIPRLRDIDAIGDADVVLTVHGLRLAEWVARTYRTTLYEALALQLPPGVGQEAETTWRASAGGMRVALAQLPERERALLYYLRSQGEQSERQLREALRGTDADLRQGYAMLAERGLIERGSRMSQRQGRPRYERIARLAFLPTIYPGRSRPCAGRHASGRCWHGWLSVKRKRQPRPRSVRQPVPDRQYCANWIGAG